MLGIRDWYPDLGGFGKLHVRFGKGSRGRGPKPRLVPAINGAASLLDWWITDVRHQYGDDWDNPDAPLFPSERTDLHSGCRARVGDDALRSGLQAAVTTWLPAWASRMTPHVMRHYCASSLYENGMGLKAIQQLRGHDWLSTTTIYVHVKDSYVESSWMTANQRVADRFGLQKERSDALESAASRRREGHLEVRGDAPAARGARLGDQRREDVRPVDVGQADHDPARGP